MAPHDPHRRHLEGLARRDRLRALAPRAGLDFASNDYLSLATSPELRAVAEAALARGVPLGSGGSRLLRGNHPEHEALEAEAAAFFGAESALWLSSGYGANSMLVATLPQRGDLIVHDALIHASTHEGLRLTRGEAVPAAHNDADAFADAIAAWRARGGMGRPWIAVESLYSMDGDRAPLAALAAIADRHEAYLLIDEAHATGVFGADGRGLAGALEGRENVVTLHTCGKGLGCEGALIAAPRVLTDYIVNQGRGFIFSTAPSPLMAAVARGALALVRDRPERRDRLAALVAAAAALFEHELGVAASGSQIQPVILGDNGRAMRVAGALQQAGFDVRGIRPPTVPDGTARLRVSLTLNVSETDVAALVAAIGAAL
ncbi:8-amino-7-oxononanoate synthase [Flavisphingomonas formosensis]|uniref:8-amino-7-oxononanoate synthase n=1 Tax=Flavisphingomonas formosensis TaxID=861534 RepID=UPI0012F91ECD|nr:8-amino-7-oxononanoate synthase [Sphingomonas formosensis]